MPLVDSIETVLTSNDSIEVIKKTMSSKFLKVQNSLSFKIDYYVSPKTPIYNVKKLNNFLVDCYTEKTRDFMAGFMKCEGGGLDFGKIIFSEVLNTDLFTNEGVSSITPKMSSYRYMVLIHAFPSIEITNSALKDDMPNLYTIDGRTLRFFKRKSGDIPHLYVVR